MRLCVLLFLVFAFKESKGLDNGLALTPPMGFMTWQRFRCTTDCKTFPRECISEELIFRTADAMVKRGYKDAGYEYLIIDDCWLSMHRDNVTNKLQSDPERFPNGMKFVGDYIHSKGLKFGLYEDYGTETCMGYPGVIDNMELDANTFAEYGVDYVKLDGCNSDPHTMDKGYPEFGRYLNATGRPMVYSCSWPAYLGDKSNYSLIKEYCNLWRNNGDIQDSYGSLSGIIDEFKKKQKEYQPVAGPGHWNDPDMLLIGNFGLSVEQSKLQMALWAILAAPLLISVDLDTIRPEFKKILLNRDIIAVNQDRLGIQGLFVHNNSDIEVWVRKVEPVVNENYSLAVAVLGRFDDGMPKTFTLTRHMIGTDSKAAYSVRDLYDIRKKLPNLDRATQSINVRVNPSGVVFYKFQPMTNEG